MVFEIVSESAGAGAFIARHVKIFASERAVGEMNSGVGAVHPCSTVAAAPQTNCSLALPIHRIAIGAADCEVDYRRTLPLPLTQKIVHIGWNKRTDCPWRHCTLDVEPKIIRRIEQIGPDLAALMMHPQIADECALAVPGKIGRQIRERHIFVRELPENSVPNDVRSKSFRSEIYRTGDFDQRRRMKFHAGERSAQTESVKKRF